MDKDIDRYIYINRYIQIVHMQICFLFEICISYIYRESVYKYSEIDLFF